MTETAQRESAPGEALLPVKHRWVLTIGIMGAMVMQILDTTIANVALPHMKPELGATTDTVTWVLTSYIVATAVVLPATGWLTEKFGSRNLFVMAVGGFIIASMLCGTAVSLDEMVAFRVLQGISAAFINPLSQTALLDINAPEDQAKAMSVWGMGVMVAPILGPVLGGFLTENYSWRWVFYVNVPIGAATFAILWFLLPDRPRSPRTFDAFGFTVVALAVASFQLMLDRGQGKDWFNSPEIVLEALLCLAALWMAVVHLATAKKPLFHRGLFKDRNLMMGSFFMVVIGISSTAPLALLPPLLQTLFGYPVVETGLLMAPRGVAIVTVMWLASRLMGKVDTRILIIVGLAIFAYSLRMMSGWSLQMDYWPVITCGFLQGIGSGLVFMPLNALAFATLKERLRTDGASWLSLMRSVGQSAGISIVTVVLARNMQTAHSDLASHITAKSIPTIDLGSIDRFGSLSDTVFTAIDATINQQAAMIAYIDDFYMMAWTSLAVIPLVLLLKSPKGKVEAVITE